MRVPLIAALLAALAIPSAASAATFDVTTTNDTMTCNSGSCSLRGAIIAANGDPDADVVNVPAGTYRLTIVGDEDDGLEGDLDVRRTTTINGAGPGLTIVEQGDDGEEPIADRIFDVQPQGGDPVTVTIRDLTARRGQGFVGGGVRSTANLTLERVVVRDNEGFEGGGVAQTSGTSLLRIVDSTVASNVGGQGGGVGHTETGHSDTAEIGVLVERSTISNNRAAFGIEGDPDGAGISVTRGGDLRVRSSTITGNVVQNGPQEDTSGGGIYVNSGVAEVVNSTIHGNVVEDGYGGGIANTDGRVSLLNVTLTDNRVVQPEVTRRRAAASRIGAAAVEDPGDPSLPGGNYESFGRADTFKNTIISGGSPQNCRGRFDTIFTSNGHNLESANTCGFDQATDLRGTDPQLGALAFNGGFNETRALAKGSPAVDSADNAACPSVDQRGIARPQPAGGTCDRGAFEREAIDLAITKLASATSVKVGEEVRFTLAVSNAGPGDATGVKVTDSLPDGLEFVSSVPSRGTCSGTSTVTCELGTITADQNEDVVIRAKATRAGDFTNTATVASDGNFPESNTENNSSSARVSASAQTTPGPDPDPGPEPCRDVTAPITELAQSRVRVRRHKVSLSGTTRDPDQCASGVNRVLVSLARVRGRHLVNCRFIRSKTRYLLTPAPGMNCQDPVLFLAKGGVTQSTETADYSFSYFVSLPDGIYRAQARAWDNAGNKERPTKGRNIRKFFVR